MLRQCQVNASNLKLGAGFPNIRDLVRNLPKIVQSLVHADTDSLRCNRKLCPFASIEAHGNVALSGIGGGGGRGNPGAGRTWGNSGRGRRCNQSRPNLATRSSCVRHGRRERGSGHSAIHCRPSRGGRLRNSNGNRGGGVVAATGPVTRFLPRLLASRPRASFLPTTTKPVSGDSSKATFLLPEEEATPTSVGGGEGVTPSFMRLAASERTDPRIVSHELRLQTGSPLPTASSASWATISPSNRAITAFNTLISPFRETISSKQLFCYLPRCCISAATSSKESYVSFPPTSA